jgi:hypothetical protein
VSRRTEHPCQLCDAAPAHSLGERVVLCTRCIRLVRAGDAAGITKAVENPRTAPPLSRDQAAKLARALVEVYAGPRAHAAVLAGGDPTHHLPRRFNTGWAYGDGDQRVAAWFDDGVVHLTVGSQAALLPFVDGWTVNRALIVLRRLVQAAGLDL